MYQILFLCTGNSARSIMAEAILNRLGVGKFQAHSAGSQPRGQVDPVVLELLQRLNYSTDSFHSKDWSVFSRAENPDAPEMDFVFTVCDKAAAEPCPVWSGQPMTAHWGVADPVAADGDELTRLNAYRDAYRQLYNRINVFVNLPMQSLDKLSLQSQLTEIGTLQASEDCCDV